MLLEFDGGDRLVADCECVMTIELLRGIFGLFVLLTALRSPTLLDRSNTGEFKSESDEKILSPRL